VKKYFINILIVSHCLIALVSAQPKYSAETIIERVQKKYSTMDDASALFVEKIKLRFGKTEQVVNGSVKIKKGNKYKIVTSQQQIVTDGKIVWVYNPVNNQVLLNDFKENSATFSPEKFLQGFPSDFTPTGVEEKEGLLVVSLKPSSSKKQNGITSLTMWIKQEEWIVSRVEYIDRNVTSYTISLSDIQFNKGIQDNEFRFVPGKETSVVDLRTLK
jgi:chaperone LolA